MNIHEFLRQRGVAFDLLPHRETFTANEMAEALSLPRAEVAKTVLLSADDGYKYFVAVLPATKQVDLSRLSKELDGSRIELASEKEIAEHCPDCELGALPPFGSSYGMSTIMDESLKDAPSLVFEGNSHHEAIRISLADYLRLEEPLILDFARSDQRTAHQHG